MVLLSRWERLLITSQRFINSSPSSHLGVIPGLPITTAAASRLRRRTIVPTGNSRLTEVITIYEKLTKSRGREEPVLFRPTESSNYFEYLPQEEDVSNPCQNNEINVKVPGTEQHQHVLDFNKFRNIFWNNYSYFSAETGLLQGNTLDSLKIEVQLPSQKAQWQPGTNSVLKIVNPTEEDFAFLGTRLNVNDLTLRDIREQETDEKVEVFNNYTFLSLQPHFEQEQIKKSDLNIILFRNFVIIIHYGDQWNGFSDMLGFLNLLNSYGSTPVTPDWVVFSLFIELAQDAKYYVKRLEPNILDLRVADINNERGNDLSTMLTQNFKNEFEVYKINRFIKPKIKVLKMLKYKCGLKLFSSITLNLVSSTRKELEELEDVSKTFSHVLERSQDTCLTLANVMQSEEANRSNHMMKRISEVALLFLPLQAVAGFLGMNVPLPLSDTGSTVPFWGIVLSSTVLCVGLYTFSRRVPTNSGMMTGSLKKTKI